ncbi:MAG: HAMP domain-containing sensor histidine kinase [Opitutus sp.]
MTPASRRIFLYWLLLLIPALVVGGVAIQLLRREEARLAVQGAQAEEARRAGVSGRARLVAENVELLIGDVQAALLDTLATEPAANLDEFLDQWQKNNPLVRTAFLASPDGQLVRPGPSDPNDEARGFIRRFASQFRSSPPWSQPINSNANVPAAAKKTQSLESKERNEVASNVAQLQSARRDVQELAKARNYSPARPSIAANSETVKAEADVALTDQSVSSAPAGLASTSEPSSRIAQKSTVGALNKASRRANEAELVQQRQVAAKDGFAERRGWIALRPDRRLHLLGWVQPRADENIRGVELELAAVISRLAGTLPADVPTDEGYALRDDQGRVVHQVGALSTAIRPTVEIPLSDTSLPGWSVIGVFNSNVTSGGNGAGFVWVGVLLVAIFVCSILAGGSLLLRQARRSETEAAQKTSFVANVSHEFKTPLTTIRLYAELLEQGRVRDEQQGGDFLRTIGRETQRLARLVNNALDFSRLEQGQKKYARESVELGSELNRLLDTHAPRVTEAGLTMTRAFPPTPIPVTTDPDAVEQIVLNLIDNACKYADAGGELTISATATPGTGAEVRVADRGPGVPVDQRERIFEKFHRVNDALTAEKTGAGLGLSIARQLARGLGGDLVYEARSGGGAEFVLKLP